MRSSSALLLFVVAGCARPDQENLGIAARDKAAAVDVARLTDPVELVRELGLTGSELDRKLGRRRMEAQATIKVEAVGKPAETLDQSWKLDSDGAGALHLVHETTHGGKEAIVSAGELYIRPRWGKFIKRRPEGDEIERLRGTVEGAAGDYLALLERFIKVREEGRTQIAGRSAAKLKLSAQGAPAAAVKQTDPARAWRQTVQTKYVDGEVMVDAASAAPLAINLAASWTFERDKSPVAVTLTYKMTTVAAEPIVAPADFAPAPRRPRPMLDKKELLEGIVP